MNKKVITRAGLIERLSKSHQLPPKLADEVVKNIMNSMITALIAKKRIEIRGFGSFDLKVCPSRKARNPKTGAVVYTEPSYTTHFKAGKILKDRLNPSDSRLK